MDSFEQLFAMLGLADAEDEATLDRRAVELAQKGVEPEQLGMGSTGESGTEVPGSSQFQPLQQTQTRQAPSAGVPRASRPVDLITPFLQQMQQSQIASRQQAQPLFGAPLFGGG